MFDKEGNEISEIRIRKDLICTDSRYWIQTMKQCKGKESMGFHRWINEVSEDETERIQTCINRDKDGNRCSMERRFKV